MSGRAGILEIPKECLPECTCEQAHAQLKEFVDACNRWQEQGWPRKRNIRTLLFLDFLNKWLERVSKEVRALEGSRRVGLCRRFLLLLWKCLHLPSADFRSLHEPQYLSTCGWVAGCALHWKIEKELKVDSGALLEYWREKFEAGGWAERSSILDAFLPVVANCTQWDEYFWGTLDHFVARFKAGLSGPKIALPREFYSAFHSLVFIWYELAHVWHRVGVEYENEEKEGRVDEKIRSLLIDVGGKILGFAPELLMLIHKAWLYLSYEKGTLEFWLGMLSDYTLPVMKLLDPEKAKAAAKVINEELEKIHREGPKDSREENRIEMALQKIGSYK